jgi:type 2 lantibiotic biosynthesis protein LanM
MTSWQSGMTLAERLAARNLRQNRKRATRPSASGQKVYWRSECRADIARVKEPAALPLDQPLWLKTFRTAYAEAEERNISSSPADALLVCVDPVIAAARDRIDASLRGPASGICPASKEVRAALVASLEVGLRKRLFDVLSKTLVLELAVASRFKVLAGKTAGDRFAFFCDCLADHDFTRALLEQYPVLVRRIATITCNWEATSIAMLSRLSDSHQALRDKFFGGNDPGPLTSANATGDTHCGGQSVHILHFESGRRLVYKPRSVALEGCFFDLIGWLNRNGCEPALKEVRTLDEGHFGWMEFVEERPCQTREEVERFFVRQGAQIALLYVLGGTDLHSENVIAHGEHPVLVDLETLFQTPIHSKVLTGATALGWRTLRMSVMGTQLLPEPMFLAGDGHWIDISALGHGEGQITPFRVPVWSGGGTDRMRLLHKRIPILGGRSLPEYERVREPASQNVDLVVRGLRCTYNFLRRRKAALLSESGPLATGFGKSARRVFRDTNWYARLLDASYHPRYLDDAITLEAFLRNRLRTGSNDTPWFSAIEDAEVADLLSGDIPYFASSVGQLAPLTASEKANVVLPGDGWEECRARVRAMSDTDLDRQARLMRVAMIDLEAPTGEATHIYTELSSDQTPAQLVAAAERIGDRLCEQSITDGGRATWIVPTAASKSRLMNGVAGLDLYNGLPGIALFLGYLNAVTGNDRYGEFAVAAMAEALALYKVTDSGELALGAYDGVGGISYALLHLGGLLGRPEWIVEATEILRNAAKRAEGCSGLDIISGKAGFIVAALAVHRAENDAALIRSLRPLADELRELATASRKSGKSFLPATTDAGVAHGRAGIGFALSRWAEATGDGGLGAIAAELIRFDLDAIDAMCSESFGLKAPRGRTAPQLSWCRGWLGAALVALQATPTAMMIEPDQDFRFRHIADEIIGFGIDGPSCLCHGALGHMEFLAAAAERGLLDDIDAVAIWRRRLLARLTGGDWGADKGYGLASPGLMVGLAGTGYSLLRAAQPQLIPSVLMLEPPPAKRLAPRVAIGRSDGTQNPRKRSVL